MSKSTLYLVDISSYIFRAYYAVKALKTSKGIPTNATYGVVTMLLRLIREKKPDYLVLVFDSPVPTFRKKIFADYKANRPLPPEDLSVQFDHIKEFIKTFPLCQLEVAGFEADDLIATLVAHYREGTMGGRAGGGQLPARNEVNTAGGGSEDRTHCPHEERDCVIVSADKDLMQLVGPGVVMYDSMKEKFFGPKEVEEKFGVVPEQVVDLLALAGDASDNIPGVKGVGEKTAAKLIQEYRSLENLLDSAGQIKGKLGANLVQYKADALLSKKLATLHADVPLEISWEEMKLLSPNNERLNEFYKKFEFHRLIEETAQISGKEEVITAQKKPPKGYDLILTENDLDRWVSRLEKAKEGFSFDTETTSIDPMRAKLVGLSFSDREGEGCYIPLAHSYLGAPAQLETQKVLDKLSPLLTDPKIPKFAQHAKYDMEVLARVGLVVDGLQGDSLLASYLINPEAPHNLDRLSLEYLNYTTLHFEEVVGKNKTFDSVDLETACRYSAEDADVTLRLIHCLHPLLEKENLIDCYEKIELPLVPVLKKMEMNGVFVDCLYLEKLGEEFGSRLVRLSSEICENASVEFNLNSPKQVAQILFTKLNLPVIRKTKTGASTDMDVLTELAPLHPVPRLLLGFRTLSKLKSTYIDQLQRLIHPETGRLHTSYNQTVAATGRLSSSDPNLQNIPIRTEEGKRIREAFRAPPGFVLLSADYSQIELRLLAAFSGDKNLIQAFERGEDVHRMTAEKIFEKKADEVTDDLRSMAKTVNFGVIYGQTPFGLSKQLGISVAEAKKFIDSFYRQFPAVQVYRETVLKEALGKGEVRTWQGRRRLVPDLASRNPNLRNNAERAAFNTVFQGSAADLIKVAMIRIDQKLIDEKFKTKMILQVHDELVFEVPEAEKEKVQKMIVHEMENAIPCPVALKVDVGIGPNWAEAD